MQKYTRERKGIAKAKTDKTNNKERKPMDSPRKRQIIIEMKLAKITKNCFRFFWWLLSHHMSYWSGWPLSLACLSAHSCPWIPQCAGIHCRVRFVWAERSCWNPLQSQVCLGCKVVLESTAVRFVWAARSCWNPLHSQVCLGWKVVLESTAVRFVWAARSCWNPLQSGLSGLQGRAGIHCRVRFVWAARSCWNPLQNQFVWAARSCWNPLQSGLSGLQGCAGIHCRIRFVWAARSCWNPLQSQVCLGCKVVLESTAESGLSGLQGRAGIHCRIRFVWAARSTRAVSTLLRSLSWGDPAGWLGIKHHQLSSSLSVWPGI